MADSSNDILMRICLTKGDNGFLAAECQTEVTTDEDVFVYDYYNGQFCEVKEFSFGVTLDDKDAATDKVNTTSNAGAPAAGGGLLAGIQAQKAKMDAANAPTTKFARWKSATPEQIKSMPPYMPDMQEFSITRLYDKASPILFEKCCNSVSIESISIVKRKLIGANMLRGFLRFDFTEVLVTHVEWQNAEVMKESFKFAFRFMKVKYRRVVPKPGSDQPDLQVFEMEEWSYDAALKKATGK
jgi:type VI protein secretion system component Hcp